MRKNLFSNGNTVPVIKDWWKAVPADIKQNLIAGKFKLALHK
jgi:hypothetical protein